MKKYIPFLIIISMSFVGVLEINKAQSNDSFESSKTKIVFTSWRDGDSDIYIMNPDGSGVVNLTNNDYHDFSPRWSPDGKRIAYTSYNDTGLVIYIMNADGTNKVRLSNTTGFASYPAWSPDGTKIAYTAERRGEDQVTGCDIYVINADETP